MGEGRAWLSPFMAKPARKGEESGDFKIQTPHLGKDREDSREKEVRGHASVWHLEAGSVGCAVRGLDSLISLGFNYCWTVAVLGISLVLEAGLCATWHVLWCNEHFGFYHTTQ